MKNIILSLMICFIFNCGLMAQNNFKYLSNFSYNTYMNDAIEWNGNYYLVGYQDSSGMKSPRMVVLDQNGKLIQDSIFPMEGYYSNIHQKNNLLYVSVTLNAFSFEADVFVLDSNLNVVDFLSLEDGYLQKSRMLNDSIIISVGYVDDSNTTVFQSWVNLLNVNSSAAFSLYPTYSFKKKIDVFDILPKKDGYYFFTNTPDSSIANRVLVYKLNDSLETVDSSFINTSYSQFVNNSPLLGPVTATALSDSAFLLNGTIAHPIYANQTNSMDIGVMILDSNLQEVQLNFAGKTDTNAVSGNNAIANLDGNFYLGNTENTNGLSEFMVSKVDSAATILWTKYYRTEVPLSLNKILSTNDHHLLLVGSYKISPNYEQAFVVKTDTALSNLKSALQELELKAKVKVFPNPFQETIQLHFNEIPQNGKVSLFQIDGKLMKILPIQSNEMKIDCSNLPKGIFLLSIESNDQIYTKKIVKQ